MRTRRHNGIAVPRRVHELRQLSAVFFCLRNESEQARAGEKQGPYTETIYPI
jgi:hypothetical protein